MRLIYTLLLYLLLPAVLLRLVWRSRRQSGYLEHVAERFGHYAIAADAPIIWVHAVSVGETRAAEPLINALFEKYPGHRILLTHMTPTGRETGEALYGDRVRRCYLPYDYPGAVARFLDHFRPQAGIVMETEVWPNLIRACEARSVPLYLVNARLSEKSYTRYRRVLRLAQSSFAGFTKVAAQSAEDAQRLAALGAGNVHVTGSIKFDIKPPPAQIESGRVLRRGFGETRPVLLVASTRDGEEALLLEQLPRVDVPDLLTVIVPRHPQRFEEVARLVQGSGLLFQRRSTGSPVAPETRVLLGDSMGEMFAYYAACDVAFIGGSLLPFGGHNLIEACAAGKPVLVGPHIYNFAETTELAVRAGAAVQVPDAETLRQEASRLLRDPAAAGRMGKAGLAFCGVHRGATAKVLELIQLRTGR